MYNTVLMTTIYNRKNYLSAAIDSALNQSVGINSTFLHLLLDNGSQDGALDIAKSYANKYPHIELIEFGKNIHQLPAYNHGIKYIREKYPEIKYWCCLDSDDLLGKFAIEEGIRTMEANPRVMGTYSDFHVIDAKGRVAVKKHPKSRLIGNNDCSLECQKQIRKMNLEHNMMTHFRFFRLDFLERIGGFPTTYPYSTDYLIYQHALENGPVVKIPKVLYLWRDHGSKKSSQVEKAHGKEQNEDMIEMQKYYRERWIKMGLI